MLEPAPFFTYDLETHRNFFLFVGKFLGNPKLFIFEISSRKNQRTELFQFLMWLAQQNVTTRCRKINSILMVGFNNLGFDYPIIHELLTNPHTFTYELAYNMAQKIIEDGKDPFKKNKGGIWLDNRKIHQLDLFKMNHFDNSARGTNLKAIQFAMRLKNVADMPIEIGTWLTPEQMDQMTWYGCHDVEATEMFLIKNMKQIELRMEFLDADILKGDVLNYNDTKIGKEYLVKQIGRDKCYNGKVAKQTLRAEVRFNQLMLPLTFTDPRYQEVYDWYKTVIVYPSAKAKDKKKKEDKIKKVVHLYGLDYHFGLGGIHASVKAKVFHSTANSTVVDIDVTSLYPSIAIENEFYPEHLGQDFVVNYRELRARRVQYKKGTPMNAMLKLALNGVFGDSNNPYSVYYDPKFMYSITINGQMLIFQLAERIAQIPGVQIIQVNTDGISADVPNAVRPWFEMVKTAWQNETRLQLEEVEYKSMFVRDVNNYLCVSKDGKIKSKGAYWYPKTDEDYEGWWNKNFSCLVVQKGVEKVLVNGFNPEVVCHMMYDPFDYMLMYRAKGASQVFIGDIPQLKTTRYYISKTGKPMHKLDPARGPDGGWCRKNKITDAFYNQIMSEIEPGAWDERIHTKNQSTYGEVTTKVESGWLVKNCNDAADFDWNDVDLRYYEQQIKDLIIE